MSAREPFTVSWQPPLHRELNRREARELEAAFRWIDSFQLPIRLRRLAIALARRMFDCSGDGVLVDQTLAHEAGLSDAKAVERALIALQRRGVVDVVRYTFGSLQLDPDQLEEWDRLQPKPRRTRP